jgi:AmmeMemoRadiSam system protein B/AmmeMemoRadiSam system protein A
MEKRRKKLSKALILLAILIIIIGTIMLIIKSSPTGFLIKEQSTREPVFAGSWYPADKEELQNLTTSYLDNSKSINFNGRIKAIIVPHAGYIYSGQIAAGAFKQLTNDYKDIFLLGPSHQYYLTNVSVSHFNYFSTPLGKVKVSKLAKEMDEKEEIISNIEQAHEKEHALEVELPFLQTQLQDSDSQFEIIPLIVGETDTNELKNVLSKYVKEDDLIIVSADLSHYHEYNQALILDAYSLNNIINLDDQGILNSEIDAPWAVSSLLKLAKEKSWKPYLIVYANSGEITGNKSSVVGYSAVVFVDESTFTKDQKQFLLELARESAEKYLKTNKTLEINEKDVPENLKIKKACFVTFTEDNQLRGCIGHIVPQMPLYQCVIENAINAATKDTRFSPVNYSEMKKIKIDVSVLSIPSLLQHNSSEELLSKLKPKVHGVILKRGTDQSTFLPSVWEFIPDKQEFLANLCMKGNMEAECWKDMKTEVYVYTAEDFSE